MSLVTLNKYLLGRRQQSSEESVLEKAPDNYLDMASRTIAAVRRSVFLGEPYADLFEEADAVRKDLHIEPAQEIVNQCAARMEDVLATYQTRVREAESDRAADFRSVLDILNEALSYLNDDSQKSEGRRKQLENNLTLAARMDDIASLRNHLTKILHSVRDEGRRERDRAQEAMDRFGQQVEQVYKSQMRFTSGPPGRDQAMEHLKQLWQPDEQPGNLHVALFVADSLHAIRERHGEEVARSILQDIGRKYLKDLAPEAQIFAWSPTALMLIWRHTDNSSSASDIATRLRLPCEQRVFVGARVAIFNIMLRSLVIQVREKIETVEKTLDRFSQRGGGC